MAMKVIIGADPLGFAIKEDVKKYLLSSGYEVEDITGDGPIDYYNVGSVSYTHLDVYKRQVFY